MAEENLTLFTHCFTKGHDALQVTAVHVLTDILTTHPSLISAPEADENFKKSILKIFVKGMRADHIPEVQSATVVALCKLMLTSVITDEDLLKQAVVLYFDPGSKENAGVRQALSYFLPVYCHSRRENMERMATVAAGVMHSVVDLSEEIEEGGEMVGLSAVGNMLVDWTDARKLVVQDEAAFSWDEVGKKETKAVNGDIHLDLADNVLERVMTHSCSSMSPPSEAARPVLTGTTEEDRKALISMLGKLYITPNSDAEKLQNIATLVMEAIDDKIAGDATSRNALNKLHAALNKAMGETGKAKKFPDGDSPTVGDGLTVMDVDESVVADEREVREEAGEVEDVPGEKDSLLEELLEDEEEL